MNRKELNFTIYLIILSIMTFLFTNVNEVKNEVYWASILIVFLLTFIVSLKLTKRNYILPLFLITLFTFQYGRLVLIPLFFDTRLYISWFIRYIYSEEVIKFTNDVLLVNIFSINLGILLYLMTRKKGSKNKTKIHLQNKVERVLFTFAVLTFPFFMINQYSVLKYVIQYGYESLYKVGFSGIKNTYGIINIVSNLSQTSIVLLLIFIPKEKRKGMIITFLFIFQSFVISLRGQRSIFIGAVFAGLWYISSNYNIKLDLKKTFKVLCLGVFLIIFSQEMKNFRGHKGVERSLPLKEKVINFFQDQGGTGAYIALLKVREDIFKEHKVPFIFSSITGESGLGQTPESYNKIINSKNVNLQYKLSAKLNRELFINGNGTGGNYVLEMYDLGGLLGIIFFSSVLTFVLLHLGENFMYYPIVLRGIVVATISSVFLIPRSNYFPSIFPVDYFRIFLAGSFYYYFKNTNLVNIKRIIIRRNK